MASLRILVLFAALFAAHSQASRDCARAVKAAHAQRYPNYEITRVDSIGKAPGKLEVPGLGVPFSTSVEGQAFTVWDEYMSGVGVTGYVVDERCLVLQSENLYSE